jgi:hypothetical protein
MYIHTYTYIHKCMHTYIHAYMHTYKYTHINLSNHARGCKRVYASEFCYPRFVFRVLDREDTSEYPTGGEGPRELA